MFSQHPFTLQHRYSLGAIPALPAWKRVLDVTCCIAALPLFASVTLVFAVLVKLSSNGPILFRQQSAGCLGRSVGVYRFRTMRIASHAVSESIAGSESPRSQRDMTLLIPGGHLLRATGLVDLPGIVNVLRGEMSIVGLRPCSAASGETLAAEHRSNLAAVPGLTGMWRLACMSHATDDEALRWEQSYVANMSFKSDLKVITRTLLAMFGLRGR
jgi:exopolysaccharide production protein ExoY